MLSISKLVAGQARYYLDQARGRVDVVESVGDGVEEYYAGGSEARGQWLGAGAAGLDLAGPVDGPALRAVLAGIDPSDGERLRGSASPVHVAGYDLTYSASKSVSVLFGIGDADVRAAIRRAHDRAVRESLDYLERSAAAVRRGHGGVQVEPADGFVAAAFRHRTSRAGDPQLHTHVLVANVARAPDGRWSALDGRRLYAHARTASFLYQAVLRDELSRTLGVAWGPVRKGIAEVLGVPKPVLHAFSRRRAEIVAALEERGTSGARAAEAAALATRQPKGHALDGSELQASWRERAAEHGFAQEDVHRILGGESERRVDPLALERAFGAMASPLGLTRRASTFNRRDVIQALCERLPSGIGVDAQWLEQAADRFLASSKVIALMPNAGAPATAEVFRRRDGRVLPLAREQLLYSTPELLALEQRLIQRATSLRGTGAGVASAATVAAAIAARPTLSPEQRTMIDRLCGAGDGVAVVVGRAGSGKTHALGAAREAWQAAGYPVFGVAIARRAARELEDGAGIASTSVAAYLSAVRRGVEKPPDRCVLVIDEAGMLPTRQLSQLMDSIERVRGKLVLVGDHRQLPELEAGGAFRGLVHRGLAIELDDNRRQVHAWERVALDHLREGRSEQALDSYRTHDRLVVHDTANGTRERLVEDWWRTGDPDRAVMIAHRRDDVADLNLRARARLRRAGALGADELALPGGGFAVGDRVVVRRNHMRLGVHNGDRATVVAVDLAHGRLTIESRGVRITLDSGFLYDRTAHGEPTLAHGYAITAHVAQGLTVDHALVFADETITRELAYTALSRGRQTNRLYVAACSDDPRAEYVPTAPERTDGLKRLTAALRTSSKASLAIDLGTPVAENQRLTQAEAELRTMSGRRRALEARRGSWLPGRRAAIEAARRAEAVAGERLAELRNKEAERRHGERPFVSEEDLAARVARSQQRAAERRVARALGRGRGRGRQL